MFKVYARDIKNYVPAPGARELKVLLSPKIHKQVSGVGIGMSIFPSETSSNIHKHDAIQEVWFVISGKGRIVINGESSELEPEMIIVAPPGTYHQLFNDSNEILKVLWIFCPSGPEEDFIIEE